MSKFVMTASFIAASLLFAVLGQDSSCSHKGKDMNNAPLEKSDRLAAEMWGGEHIHMEVTDGGGSVEFDCASGSIDQPIVLDSGGNFDVKGKYRREHAGPILRDEENNGSPARYTGRVREKVLTLTVTIKEPEEIIGTFTLAQGSPSRVMKCR
jgi:hypothetical protein